MGANTEIQWADDTFNLWRGCQRVSPGCQHCYAEAMARRNPKLLGSWGPEGTRVMASPAMWREPGRWNEIAHLAPRRVFCASLADVFEDWPGQMSDHRGERMTHQNGAPFLMSAARYQLWNLIRITPRLRWLLLTKRPENIQTMLPIDYFDPPPLGAAGMPTPLSWPSRIWLGTTVEDRKRAEDRIPTLCSVPARIRFLSCEPLLERVDLAPYLSTGQIHWVIVGGESTQGGGQARPFDLEWAEEIVNDCRRFGVKVFVKQLGSRPIANGLGLLNQKNKRHGDAIEEWPECLRVREVPEG